MVSYQKSLILSIIIHACLIAGMVGVIHENHFVGKSDYKIIHAVVLYDQPNQKVRQTLIKKTKLSQSLFKQKVEKSLVKKRFVKKLDVTMPHKALTQSKQSAHLTKGKRDRLLAELHNAVAKHLIYPASASFLNLQGSVKLGFELAPNGTISNINIITSSHITALDHAAFQTIQAISPFILAKKYLKSQEHFNLMVQFVL